jgi:hypothetical protein
LGGAHTWVLTPKILNEVRGQWDQLPVRAHVPGVTPLKPLFTEDQRRTANLTQIFNFPSLTWAPTPTSTATSTRGNCVTICRSQAASSLEVRRRRAEPADPSVDSQGERHLDIQSGSVR